jgi:hypothetical protein
MFKTPKAKRDASNRWKARNREHLRAYESEWRSKHPDKVRAGQKRYREKHPAEIKQVIAAWHTKNPTWKAERARRQRAKINADPVKLAATRAKQAEWLRNHPAAAKAIRARNVAKRHAAPGSHTAAEVRAQYEIQGGRCFYCLASLAAGYHEEHMTPLTRGGSNGIENIVCACAHCNFSKWSKTAAEFILGAA